MRRKKWRTRREGHEKLKGGTKIETLLQSGLEAVASRYANENDDTSRGRGSARDTNAGPTELCGPTEL